MIFITLTSAYPWGGGEGNGGVVMGIRFRRSITLLWGRHWNALEGQLVRLRVDLIQHFHLMLSHSIDENSLIALRHRHWSRIIFGCKTGRNRDANE